MKTYMQFHSHLECNLLIIYWSKKSFKQMLQTKMTHTLYNFLFVKSCGYWDT